MAYSKRYGLCRYSANPGLREVETAERFAAAMRAVVGMAVPVYVRDKFADMLQGQSRGTVSVLAVMRSTEEWKAAVCMVADVLTKCGFFDALRQAVDGKKDVLVSLLVGEDMSAFSYGSKDQPLTLACFDQLAQAVNGVKDVHMALFVSEALGAVPKAITQSTETAVFHLTIPAGGELRIDSENYTVLLNGANALDAQAGAWLRVSRELLRLTVESASGGGLTGQLVYTERFL